MMELSDEQYMHRAIMLAEQGGVAVAPNPKVGAVIVHNHQIIGEGFHTKYGAPHAEVEAVNRVKDQSLLAESTIYVTLEPCSHFGKTPPCCDLLIHHRFKKVVIGVTDPNPSVNGSGIQRLRNAGIEVVIGLLARECRFMNRRFLISQEKKRPYIILKWAESQDGFIDVKRENSLRIVHRISGEESHRLVHEWRSEEQGILVGWKTILNDNPQLNVRLTEGPNPIRIILDANLNAPSDSKVFSEDQETIILNKIRNSLRQNLHYIQQKDLTFANIFQVLNDFNIISVLVEGGRETLQRFIDENVWDEIRRFKGEIYLNEGVKAPEIKFNSNLSLTIKEDQLDIYYNNIF